MVSPSRQPLYRTAQWVVICTSVALMLVAVVSAQAPAKTNKGPRALALVELAPNGKAHLVPVTIMLEGKFYDAAAYKASPVPMVLESGTVYEGILNGVSQGFFTVTGALQARNTWLGEGRWVPAGSEPTKKASAPSKPPDEDVDAPPVLRREKPKSPEPPPAETKPQPAPAPSTLPSATPTPSPAAEPASPPEDPDRPQLHRGKPEPAPNPAPDTSKPAATNTLATKKSPENPPQIRTIPAISDANGPDPRPYWFVMKSDEQQELRKKMLALASSEIQAYLKTLAANTVGSPKAKSQPPHPAFDDIQLKVFDLSNVNEPVLVLSATARTSQTAMSPERSLYFTLVAREDLYGELHKALSNVTDASHLDVTPRMELIDAVDADGDGHGELLFRQVSDAGSAFVIYRVIGYQLWPLFQGAPE